MHEDEVIVIDDFYQDPDKIREIALECDYSIKDSQFFDRSSSFIDPMIRSVFEEILDIDIVKDRAWLSPRKVEGSKVTNGANFNGTFYKISDEIEKLNLDDFYILGNIGKIFSYPSFKVAHIKFDTLLKKF